MSMKNADLDYRCSVSVDSYCGFFKSYKSTGIRLYMSSANSPERQKIYHDFNYQKIRVEVDAYDQSCFIVPTYPLLLKVEDDRLHEKT